MIAEIGQITYSPYRSNTVRAIPALKDNYIWCIGTDSVVVVVDPGQAQPVFDELSRRGASLAAILVTHHHHDHVDGIPALKARWPQARVIGPARCQPLGVDETVRHGDAVDIPEIDLHAWVLATPGHTQDHLSYFCAHLPDHPHPALFCGDTLFSAGCGRVFDGTVEQLFDSLGRLGSLPEETQAYAAHEYTITNLQFAIQAEPENPQLQQRLRDARLLRDAGLPTLPVPLHLEHATNPFLRSHLPALAQHLPEGDLSPSSSTFNTFAALRRWRNSFQPPADN